MKAEKIGFVGNGTTYMLLAERRDSDNDSQFEARWKKDVAEFVAHVSNPDNEVISNVNHSAWNELEVAAAKDNK